MVVKVDSQRIPQKSSPALDSKLRQEKPKAASNLAEYSYQSHLRYHAALKHFFLAPNMLTGEARNLTCFGSSTPKSLASADFRLLIDLLAADVVGA